MQKFSFHESQLIERNQASIENTFRSIKQESSIDQIRKRLQDNFLQHFDWSQHHLFHFVKKKNLSL